MAEGKKVRLRQVGTADAAAIARWKNDPVVREGALGPGEAGFAEQAEDIALAVASGTKPYFLVLAADTGEPVGYVRADGMDPEGRGWWLRFALGARRGEGLGTAAVAEMCRRLFGEGAHRIEAEVFEGNEASRRLLAGLGFVEEGRKREAHHDGTRFRDVLVLGLLRGDFRPDQAG